MTKRKPLVLPSNAAGAHDPIRSMVSATSDKGRDDLLAELVLAPQFACLPWKLIDAFVKRPGTLQTADFARVLGISRARFRHLVMAGGFKRSEHLVTALRAAAWIWFARLGAHRPTFERYLGIYDRGNFRRACRRAGIEPPWKVLNSAV